MSLETLAMDAKSRLLVKMWLYSGLSIIFFTFLLLVDRRRYNRDVSVLMGVLGGLQCQHPKNGPDSVMKPTPGEDHAPITFNYILFISPIHPNAQRGLACA